MKIINDKAFEAELVDIRNSAEYQLERIKLEVTESIIEAMKMNDVTNADLAQRLGTSRAYITKLLQGNVNFTLESLVRLSQALNLQFVPPAFKLRKARSLKTEKPRRRLNSTVRLHKS